MYQNIWIENFRGLRRLSVGDLRRLNLFVGPNNVGKTSVLEALWILQNPGNPALILGLDLLRGFNAQAQAQAPHLTWPTLFNDLDLSLQIRVGGVRSDGTSESLTISHANEWPEDAEVTSNGTSPAANFPMVNLSGVTPETLYYDYQRDDLPVMRSSFSIGLGRIGVSPK